MMRHILVYEWKKLLVDRLLVLLGSIVAILVISAIVNGHAWLTFRETQIREIRKEYAVQRDSVKRAIPLYEQEHDIIGIDAPHNPSIFYGSYKTFAVKPVKSITLYHIGQSDLYPYYTQSTALEKIDLIQENEIQNPLNLLTGKLDLTFVILFVIPLLIIALAHDLYSSEAERKTIRLIKSQGIRVNRYVLFKMLFRFFLLTGIMLTTMAVTTILLRPSLLLGAGLGDWLIYVLLSVSYLLFWFILCYFVNSFNRSSVSNGVILLSLWVTFLLLAPFITGFFAAEKYPAPSRKIQSVQERQAAKDIDRKELVQETIRKNPGFDRFMKDTTVQLVFEASNGYVEIAAYDQELDRRTRSYEQRILHQLRQQEEICRDFRFASPALVLSQGMGSLSAGSTFHYLDYLQKRNDHQRRWRDFLLPRIFKKEVITAQDMDHLPAFTWKDGHKYGPGRAVADAFYMLGLAAFLLLVAYKRFQHS